MRTKLFMLLAAVLLTVGATNVYADGDNGSKTGTVTLNINLYQIQSLVVNPAQKVINLDYKTKSDYAGGVSSEELSDHLNVYSTGGFIIDVAASGANLKNGDIEGMPTKDISIKATPGTTKSLDGAKSEEIELNGTEKFTLISSDKGGVDNNFNIEYKAAGDNKYTELVNNGEETTTYTTTVTYTITAK